MFLDSNFIPHFMLNTYVEAYKAFKAFSKYKVHCSNKISNRKRVTSEVMEAS